MASSSTSQEEQKHEQQQQQQQEEIVIKECLHKTKTINFLGRTTPIVLQNDNGPCPLLAICNILLLRNNLNLSPDTDEVSQEKLLSLVAERLIDSNSNVNNKDAGYVENQQQNIADAIDLLPRLATGIDVNIKFRRIDDFEFTPECAIFDLLDIPLCHGWIVDPQDFETADAIGSKSYNALMGELVTLETQNMEGEWKKSSEEDCVDFAAATTATLGVPSPSLSKTISFEDSPCSISDNQSVRKGDVEEEVELLRALKLSEVEMPTSVSNSYVRYGDGADEIKSSLKHMPDNYVDILEGKTGIVDQNVQTEPSISDNCGTLTSDKSQRTSLGTVPWEEAYSSSKTVGPNHIEQSSTESEKYILCSDVVKKSSVDTTVLTGGDEKVENESTSPSGVHKSADMTSGTDTTKVSCSSVPNADPDSSSGRIQHADVSEAFTSRVDDNEPIYEGEECIIDSGAKVYEDREPMYEGEVILAEQTDKSHLDACKDMSKDEITPKQGELIRNFLKNSASQLTFYGLFCLQDGLKERELCVFFRNNHFSTMFKYDGELYLLATDQGYITQPDLVWEKLNEVNGDTLFMTGNFKEFKVESHSNDTWDEQDAVANTADYLASMDSAAHAGFDVNSDLQLAIALQQQEFEQQPQRQNVQQQPVTGSSRLVTGPQVARNSGRHSSSMSSRPEAKSKEKCTIM
ncbi:DUF544 domain-containing protein [Cephalotus follicularis]|uniref:DUF544 domain-containing protein n=1 Tax=Cephalotus follicularis TaxID=3775 RepID=A0A1Q3CHC7_CEPFO|nr:DUF544 domain-containing protein [Cephalotus follicularis]